MSPPPLKETNSLERELNFLKQTVRSLRDQLDVNIDLHDSEIQSLEEEYQNRETNLHAIIAALRVDYQELSEKHLVDKQNLESAFVIERKSFTS